MKVYESQSPIVPKALCSAYQSFLITCFYEDAVFVAERMRIFCSDSQESPEFKTQTTNIVACLILIGYAQLGAGEYRAAGASLTDGLALLESQFSEEREQRIAASLSVMARYCNARVQMSLGNLRLAEECLSKVFSSEMLSLRSCEPKCIEETSSPFVTLVLSYAPDDAALNSFMGTIYKKENVTGLATRHLTAALQVNPFMWTAFEALCDLGSNATPGRYFTDAAAAAFLERQQKLQGKENTEPYSQVIAPVTDLHDTQVSAIFLEDSEGKRASATTSRRNRSGAGVALHPIEKRETKRTKLSNLQQQRSVPQTQNMTSSSVASTEMVSVPSAKEVALGDSDGSTSHFRESTVMRNLAVLADAYYLYRQYNCAEAIALYRSLPEVNVCAKFSELLARCYFEMAEYRMAEVWFDKARSLEPYRVAGMDVYSSTLWHLRKEVALSHLAHDLVQNHRGTPEAWCAVGNCFSLKREHDVALKCFHRAVQVNDSFTYAHTLLGHEYVCLEDSDKAMHSFRNAIRVDKRHYNAWFGVGYIYLSQEKYSLAEFHFKKALHINHSNPILIVYMGMVAEKQNRLQEALQAFTKAHSLRPDIPLYAFRRANVLFQLSRLHEALDTLLPLSTVDPAESSVHFLLGKVYNALAREPDSQGVMDVTEDRNKYRRLAMKAFTMAQDVSSGKVAVAIRDEIEKLVVPNTDGSTESEKKDNVNDA